MKQAAHVGSPPGKPLMIYDGDCNFCKFWVTRWQHSTEDRVDFVASQDPQVAQRFPELTVEQLDRSVQFIEPDGNVYEGAEAVCHLLNHSCGWCGKTSLWIYHNVPGVAPIGEWAYRFVSERRRIFSFFTRLLWGREGALPTYSLVRWIFLRSLGLIYLIAFVSLWTQIDGLIGTNGIMPANVYMQRVRQHFDEAHVGIDRYFQLPSLCWFGASNHFLHVLCGAGTALSLLVILNLAPAPCLFLLWLIYLSLSSVCGVFLGFQWDALLLETGLLAIFFAPLQIFPKPASAPPPSRIVLWLLRWLLFRLMFESGMVKLTSHDVTWRNLSALTYHYETQPLPTWIGWYAHQLPVKVQTASVFIMFIIELVVPFLIFTPRRPRFVGCFLLMLLQVLILLTGNYCFFNLLTIALCILLLDDAAVTPLVPKRCRKWLVPTQTKLITGKHKPPEPTPITEDKALPEIKVRPKPAPEPGRRRLRWPMQVTATLAVLVVLVTFSEMIFRLAQPRSWPGWLVYLDEAAKPYESMNSYGLFAMMTTSRREIILEGSNDGKTWLPYEFKYKPGDLNRRPAFVAPHQPRLDWQMWFAALGTYRENLWLVNLCFRLLQGSRDVLGLMGHNPFPNAPPKYVRAQAYQYHFSNFAQRRADGSWWRREYEGEYLPEMSLRIGDTNSTN